VHDPWEDGDQYIDIEAIRAHLRKLSDAELIREGHAASQLVLGTSRPPRKVFVVGLEECRAEWRRRHPRTEESNTTVRSSEALTGSATDPRATAGPGAPKNAAPLVILPTLQVCRPAVSCELRDSPAVLLLIFLHHLFGDVVGIA
jgi:hypothetical protein